jgi:[acyl-carrier-protein] S-malonyltransferase
VGLVSAAPLVALLFPGQGSQVVGMGRAAAEAFPAARQVFERADRALDLPLTRTCFEGPEEALKLTATTQPAILATSIALLEALRAAAPRLGSQVACAAGHSLGEYSALVASGALTLEDAVRIVRRRGEYMQEAVPVGEGAMAAVLGAPLASVEALCRAAAQGDVLSPANLNAPDQIVVAGSAAAVRRLAPLAKEHGARRVIELPVSAPFHCALMRPAQERLAVDLETLAIRDAGFPIVTNVSARPESRAANLRGALAAQVTAPVRWVETVEHLAAAGVDLLIEVGPGKVLSGLVKRIAPGLRTLNVEDPAGVAAAAVALSATGGGA